MPRRLTAAVATIACCVGMVVTAGEALADGARAGCGGGKCGAEADTSGRPPEPQGAPSPVAAPARNLECATYADGPGVGSGNGSPVKVDPATAKVGDVVWVQCRDLDTGVDLDMYQSTWGATGATPPNPAVVARAALAEIEFPTPALRMWPSEMSVVGVKSYFHVTNAGTLTNRADDGGVWAEVTAIPRRTVWHLGTATDGDQNILRCQGPGTVWTPDVDDRRTDTCGFTFWQSTKGETITATVDVIYDVTWTSAFGGGSLGPVTQSSSFPLRVRGFEAVIR